MVFDKVFYGLSDNCVYRSFTRVGAKHVPVAIPDTAAAGNCSNMQR